MDKVILLDIIYDQILVIEDDIEEIKNRNINNENRLFVIVGRKTFSSAILNAIDIGIEMSINEYLKNTDPILDKIISGL